MVGLQQKEPEKFLRSKEEWLLRRVGIFPAYPDEKEFVIECSGTKASRIEIETITATYWSQFQTVQCPSPDASERTRDEALMDVDRLHGDASRGALCSNAA